MGGVPTNGALGGVGDGEPMGDRDGNGGGVA
ncbi:MAG: hypothetical protein IMHGJWDQ_001811 [Candidatus Fervidibacter sp.]